VWTVLGIDQSICTPVSVTVSFVPTSLPISLLPQFLASYIHPSHIIQSTSPYSGRLTDHLRRQRRRLPARRWSPHSAHHRHQYVCVSCSLKVYYVTWNAINTNVLSGIQSSILYIYIYIYISCSSSLLFAKMTFVIIRCGWLLTNRKHSVRRIDSLRSLVVFRAKIGSIECAHHSYWLAVQCALALRFRNLSCAWRTECNAYRRSTEENSNVCRLLEQRTSLLKHGPLLLSP